jgi:polysaccharide export outer membrane protein
MRKLLLFLGITLFLSSCGWLNPNIMLKTGRGYQYSKIPSTDSVNNKEYRLSSNDLVEFNLYSNDGFKLVDLTSLNSTGSGQLRITNSLEYLIETDGFCKLPILGRTKLSGMTIKEAEVMLEEKYATYYIKPFVLLKVMNKRVIVFPGSAGDAKVILIHNDNTTLMEAIALAGGIATDGKARRVKLIRDMGNNKHDVYLLDLSRIEGLTEASMVVQANDIIYIEPRKRVSSKFVQELAPVISIISNLYLIIRYTSLVTK